LFWELTDVQELRRDEERCQEFMHLCATLKIFADDFPLPSSEELLENFGKVLTTLELQIFRATASGC
jgi:hypothetical protein